MIGDSLRMIPVSSSHVIIAGDLNGKNSLWCSTDHTCPAGAAIQREFGCFGLQQLVATNTHTAPSGNQACLDLIFSNRSQLVSSIDTACALSASDHLLVLCQFDIPMDPLPSCASSRDFVQSSSARKYNFKRVTPTTWAGINDDLAAVAWHTVVTSDVDESLANIQTVLDRIFTQHISVQHYDRCSIRDTGRSRLSKQLPPWINAELKGAIRHKVELHSRSRKYPSPVNKYLFKKQRNIVRSLSRKCHREYIRKLQVLICDTSNHPSLHQFIRMQRSSGNSPGIPDLASNGKLAADPAAKAAALNEQFASVAVVDDPRIPLPSLDQHPCLPNAFRAPIITTAGVRKAIAKLKLNKSPGMDGISNEVVKALAPSLSYPLCLLFNLSFRKGKFPSAWKVAKITPIFKGKGSKATPGNYRPISLLSCISKLCERIFYDQLYSHVAPAIHPAQSGFRRGDSTSLQLS